MIRRTMENALDNTIITTAITAKNERMFVCLLATELIEMSKELLLLFATQT